MSNLPDFIIYVWLLPIVIYVIIPLSLCAVYSVNKLIQPMFNPRRSRVESMTGNLEAHMEKAI